MLGGDIRGAAPTNSQSAEDLDESSFSEKKNLNKQKKKPVRVEDEVDEELDPMKLFESLENE